MTVGKLKVLLLGDIKDFEKNMNKARRTTLKFKRQMNEIGDAMMPLTLALVGISAVSIKAASDFESAFVGVRKTIELTDEEFKKLSNDIRRLAREDLPATVTEISAVAEAAGQLGISKDNIIDFTQVMIDLGETTDLVATEAAKQLARLANITKMPQSEFRNLGSAVVELGNNMATTESEIVAMALRLAGAASVVGITEDQILGLAAALSSVGVEAQAGGTAISTMIVNIASAVESGSEALDDFAEVAGTTAIGFKQAFEDDAAGALATFISGLGRLNDEGGDVFATLEKLGLTEKRLQRALLSTAGAGDLVTQALATAKKGWVENNALTKEAQARYATFASQVKILRNRFVDIAATLGEVLIPAVLEALDAMEPFFQMISDGAEAFSELDSDMQKTVITIGLIVAAIGPLAKFAGALASIRLAIAGIGSVAGGGVFAAIASGLASIPVVGWLAAAAVAGLGLTIKHFTDDTDEAVVSFDELAESMKNAGTVWGDAFAPRASAGRTYGPVVTELKDIKDTFDGLDFGEDNPIKALTTDLGELAEQAEETGFTFKANFVDKLQDAMGVSRRDIEMWGAQLSSLAAEWIVDSEGMADAFNRLVKSIAADLIWLYLQKNIVGPLMDLLPSGGTASFQGAGGGGFIDSPIPSGGSSNLGSFATTSAPTINITTPPNTESTATTLPDGTVDIMIENSIKKSNQRGSLDPFFKSQGGSRKVIRR